jgi:hypothetical protein
MAGQQLQRGGAQGGVTVELHGRRGRPCLEQLKSDENGSRSRWHPSSGITER